MGLDGGQVGVALLFGIGEDGGDAFASAGDFLLSLFGRLLSFCSCSAVTCSIRRAAALIASDPG